MGPNVDNDLTKAMHLVSMDADQSLDVPCIGNQKIEGGILLTSSLLALTPTRSEHFT